MKDIFKKLSRYRLFIILLLCGIALLIFKPDTGKDAMSMTFGYTMEMLTVIPPIFILMGLMDVWIPKEAMMKYMGKGTGVKGGAIAFLLGAFSSGPLYAAFPVAAMFILKCSVGKGNLMFHLTGKQAFSIYNKKNGRSVRLVLKPDGYRLTRSEAFDYYREKAPEEIFDVKETKIKLPTFTRPFESYICDICGEPVSSNCIRLWGDKKLCTDCYGEVDHFHM